VGSDLDIKVFGLTLVSALLGSVGQINFKIGADKLQLNNILSIFKNYNLFIGILFYLISTIIYIYVLKFSQLTVVYPIIATSYIWTALLSNMILKESISLINIIGYLLILFGINFAITK
jgi:drug/metabolite transporter (DMT)-like permease